MHNKYSVVGLCAARVTCHNLFVSEQKQNSFACAALYYYCQPHAIISLPCNPPAEIPFRDCSIPKYNKQLCCNKFPHNIKIHPMVHIRCSQTGTIVLNKYTGKDLSDKSPAKTSCYGKKVTFGTKLLHLGRMFCQ